MRVLGIETSCDETGVALERMECPEYLIYKLYVRRRLLKLDKNIVPDLPENLRIYVFFRAHRPPHRRKHHPGTAIACPKAPRLSTIVDNSVISIVTTSTTGFLICCQSVFHKFYSGGMIQIDPGP